MAKYDGHRFGEWTALRSETRVSANGWPTPGYWCRCSCGAEHWVGTSNLTHGRTKRCDACGTRMAGLTRRRDTAERCAGSNGRTSEHGGRVISASYSEVLFDCGKCGRLTAIGRQGLNHERHSLVCADCRRRESKYPVTLSEMARMLGISRQAIHQRVQRWGYDAVVAEILGLTVDNSPDLVDKRSRGR